MFAFGYVLLLGGASDLGLGGHRPGLASLIQQTIEVDKGKQVEGGQAILVKEAAKRVA